MALDTGYRQTDDENFLHDWVRSTCPDSSTDLSSAQVRNGEDDECLAVRFHACCLRALQKISQQLSATDPGELASLGLLGLERLCSQELGKLYLCGESFTSREVGKALERANELRNSILEVLCGLGSLLVYEVPKLTCARIPSLPVVDDEDVASLTCYIDQSKAEIAADTCNVPYDSDDDDDASCLSDDYDFGSDLRSRIQMLFDLLPTLESMVEHQESFRRKHSRAKELVFQASGPAQIYISLLHDKFPKASLQLKERLGEANWQRHLNVRLRMEQAATHLHGDGVKSESIFHPRTLFHDSGIGTTVPAQSQYAPTEASHTSYVSSVGQIEKGALRVPPTPIEVGLGENFRCYICGYLQTKIMSRIHWKRHVFQDLLPYICTFPNCKDELRQFATRQAWADHEFSEHRSVKVWACPKCAHEFSEPADWAEHVSKQHQQSFSDPQLSSALGAACRVQSRPIEEEECLLCKTCPSRTRRALVTHIGRHMEEVALMALPRSDENDSDHSSESCDDGSRPKQDQRMKVQFRNEEDIPQSKPPETMQKETNPGLFGPFPMLPPTFGRPSALMDAALKYLPVVKERLASDEPERYNNILRLIGDFDFKRLDASSFCNRVCLELKQHPDLIEGFATATENKEVEWQPPELPPARSRVDSPQPAHIHEFHQAESRVTSMMPQRSSPLRSVTSKSDKGSEVSPQGQYTYVFNGTEYSSIPEYTEYPPWLFDITEEGQVQEEVIDNKSQAHQGLIGHGIEPLLSQAQLASYHAANPQLQETSIQMYAQNLANEQLSQKPQVRGTSNQEYAGTEAESQDMIEMQMQANQRLVDSGIDPGQLSQAQFASFQAQTPQIQRKAIQVYTQNLAKIQQSNGNVINSSTLESEPEDDRELSSEEQYISTAGDTEEHQVSEQKVIDIEGLEWEKFMENDINPEELSQARLASYYAAKPQIQEKSMQTYAQNLTKRQNTANAIMYASQAPPVDPVAPIEPQGSGVEGALPKALREGLSRTLLQEEEPTQSNTGLRSLNASSAKLRSGTDRNAVTQLGQITSPTQVDTYEKPNTDQKTYPCGYPGCSEIFHRAVHQKYEEGKTS